MRLCCDEVLIASESESFADAVGATLDDEGAGVVFIETPEDAINALALVPQPDALVLDGLLPCGAEIVQRLRRVRRLRDIQVIVAAPIRDPSALLSTSGVTVVGRHDFSALLDVLDRRATG